MMLNDTLTECTLWHLHHEPLSTVTIVCNVFGFALVKTYSTLCSVYIIWYIILGEQLTGMLLWWNWIVEIVILYQCTILIIGCVAGETMALGLHYITGASSSDNSISWFNFWRYCRWVHARKWLAITAHAVGRYACELSIARRVPDPVRWHTVVYFAECSRMLCNLVKNGDCIRADDSGALHDVMSSFFSDCRWSFMNLLFANEQMRYTIN